MLDKWLQSGFFARHGIVILMLALILEMLVSPAADTHPRVGAALGLVVLSMLLVGIRYMANRTIVRRVVLPLAILWIVARLLEAFGNRSATYANLSPVAGLAVSCSVLWAIFDRFHTEGRNRGSQIAEAFIAYLVIATAFSQVYWILNRFVDHPFNQVIPPTRSGEFLYFSMITLTSVGYGGIAPINPYVRNVAALESMAGIFFIAVVVARLVASYAPRPHAQAHSLADEAGAPKEESGGEVECAVTVKLPSRS